MFLKLRQIFYFIILTSFFLLIIFYYFSSENKIKINKNRTNNYESIEKNLNMVPYLENNTDNIIEYPVSDIKKNKIKKRYFWDLLKKND